VLNGDLGLEPRKETFLGSVTVIGDWGLSLATSWVELDGWEARDADGFVLVGSGVHLSDD